MQTAADLLTMQFLTWVDESPRTYAQAMDRWRTSCPRLSIWEDAFHDGLVRLDGTAGASRDTCAVTLTRRGRARLNGH